MICLVMDDMVSTGCGEVSYGGAECLVRYHSWQGSATMMRGSIMDKLRSRIARRLMTHCECTYLRARIEVEKAILTVTLIVLDMNGRTKL